MHYVAAVYTLGVSTYLAGVSILILLNKFTFLVLVEIFTYIIKPFFHLGLLLVYSKRIFLTFCAYIRSHLRSVHNCRYARMCSAVCCTRIGSIQPGKCMAVKIFPGFALLALHFGSSFQSPALIGLAFLVASFEMNGLAFGDYIGLWQNIL